MTISVSNHWVSLTNTEIGMSMDAVIDALQKNTTVRKVSCHVGFLASLSSDDLALLVRAIANKNLQDLWLALPSKYAFRSPDILELILNSPQTRLRKLTLRGLDDSGCKVLAEALRKPDACMTDLQIRGDTGKNTSARVTRRGVMAITRMLQENRSLERVDISYKGLDRSCCEAMAKVLASNHKLQKIDWKSQSLPTDSKKKEAFLQGYDALVQAVRNNYVIQQLNSDAEGDQKYLLELFPRLNRTGARPIMANTSHQTTLDEVIDVLLDNSKDISALFELLIMRPAVWDPVKACVPGFEDEEPTQRQTLCPLSPVAPANKPVMSRWSENIFTTRERERVQNFVRWTPTIIENPEPPVEEETRPRRRRRASLDIDIFDNPAALMNVPEECKPKVKRPPKVAAKDSMSDEEDDKKMPAKSTAENLEANSSPTVKHNHDHGSCDSDDRKMPASTRTAKLETTTFDKHADKKDKNDEIVHKKSPAKAKAENLNSKAAEGVAAQQEIENKKNKRVPLNATKIDPRPAAAKDSHESGMDGDRKLPAKVRALANKFKVPKINREPKAKASSESNLPEEGQSVAKVVAHVERFVTTPSDSEAPTARNDESQSNDKPNEIVEAPIATERAQGSQTCYGDNNDKEGSDKPEKSEDSDQYLDAQAARLGHTSAATLEGKPGSKRIEVADDAVNQQSEPPFDEKSENAEHTRIKDDTAEHMGHSESSVSENDCRGGSKPAPKEEKSKRASLFSKLFQKKGDQTSAKTANSKKGRIFMRKKGKKVNYLDVENDDAALDADSRVRRADMEDNTSSSTREDAGEDALATAAVVFKTSSEAVPGTAAEDIVTHPSTPTSGDQEFDSTKFDMTEPSQACDIQFEVVYDAEPSDPLQQPPTTKTDSCHAPLTERDDETEKPSSQTEKEDSISQTPSEDEVADELPRRELEDTSEAGEKAERVPESVNNEGSSEQKYQDDEMSSDPGVSKCEGVVACEEALSGQTDTTDEESPATASVGTEASVENNDLSPESKAEELSQKEERKNDKHAELEEISQGDDSQDMGDVEMEESQRLQDEEDLAQKRRLDVLEREKQRIVAELIRVEAERNELQREKDEKDLEELQRLQDERDLEELQRLRDEKRLKGKQQRDVSFGQSAKDLEKQQKTEAAKAAKRKQQELERMQWEQDMKDLEAKREQEAKRQAKRIAEAEAERLQLEKEARDLDMKIQKSRQSWVLLQEKLK